MTRSTVTPTKPRKAGSSAPAGATTFDVLVLATMSAGKTSFINALIGQELLHTANEATTACVTRVEHRQGARRFSGRSEEHTSELQSLMRTSYAVFCLKKKMKQKN